MSLDLLCVRKSTDENYGSYNFEGYRNVKKYVVIDDCICSGATMNTVLHSVTERFDAECLGILLYIPTFMHDFTSRENITYKVWSMPFDS